MMMDHLILELERIREVIGMAKYLTEFVEYVSEDSLVQEPGISLDFIPTVGMDIVIGMGGWRVKRVQVTVPAKRIEVSTDRGWVIEETYKVLCIVEASEGVYEL